jgi:hypothetical protein
VETKGRVPSCGRLRPDRNTVIYPGLPVFLCRKRLDMASLSDYNTTMATPTPNPLPSDKPVQEPPSDLAPSPPPSHPLAPVQVDYRNLLSFFDPSLVNESFERLGWDGDEMLERLINIVRDPEQRTQNQITAMKMLMDRAQVAAAVAVPGCIEGPTGFPTLSRTPTSGHEVRTLQESATRTMSVLRLISDTEEAAVQEQELNNGKSTRSFALPARVFDPPTVEDTGVAGRGPQPGDTPQPDRGTKNETRPSPNSPNRPGCSDATTADTPTRHDSRPAPGA